MNFEHINSFLEASNGFESRSISCKLVMLKVSFPWVLLIRWCLLRYESFDCDLFDLRDCSQISAVKMLSAADELLMNLKSSRVQLSCREVIFGGRCFEEVPSVQQSQEAVQACCCCWVRALHQFELVDHWLVAERLGSTSWFIIIYWLNYISL